MAEPETPKPQAVPIVIDPNLYAADAMRTAMFRIDGLIAANTPSEDLRPSEASLVARHWLRKAKAQLADMEKKFRGEG